MDINQDYLLKLERELKYRNYSSKTIETYTTCTSFFLKYIKYDISKISKETIIDFIIHLQEKKKSPKTINIYKEAIKFFTKDVLKINLDFDIKLSREAKKLPIVLTKNEILILIEKTYNIKHKLILKLAYWSWLRVSEVIDLKVTDIDIENKSIHIKWAKWNKDRITILSEKLIQDISKIILYKDKNDYIIESERGWKLTTRTLQKIFSEALKKSWIKKEATFHSLRHSFATHLLENWTDIRYIQDLLWHASIKTTQIYTKVMSSNIKNIKSPL